MAFIDSELVVTNELVKLNQKKSNDSMWIPLGPLKSRLIKTFQENLGEQNPKWEKEYDNSTWFTLGVKFLRFEAFHNLETSDPDKVESLYAPFPKTLITQYGPS